MAQRWQEDIAMPPPLGILSIAAILEKRGVDVRVTAADALRWNTEQILAEARSFQTEIIGLTITTENRFETFALARKLKQNFPQALLVIGGPHATMAGLDMIAHIPEVDIAVVGEGEETMAELVQWRSAAADPGDLKKIAGIVFRDEGQPHFTGKRAAIADLDPLPFPAKHLIPVEKYQFRWNSGGTWLPAANIMTSRGCPFFCNFCATPITWGRKVRGYSPQRVLAEIRWNMELSGARFIWFFDDTFNYDPRRSEEICDLLIREKLGIRFVAELRIDALSKALLAKMQEAGAEYVSFGVEAGSTRVRRDIIHKQIPDERIYETVAWARELGINTTAFFIFSHPTETWAEAQETLAIISRIRDQSEISVSILHIYPGTELEVFAREKGLLPADFSWAVRDRRVPLLPAAQGDVPLFKDQFTWAQLAELIIKWSFATRRISLWKKIPGVLRSIRSLGDLGKYLVMGLVFLRIKLFKK
jgi:radical SAM superfamily enzyme YgiQ (UPF0313 family)